MEYIKRKRLLENYTLRGNSSNYGEILNIKTDSLGNPITNDLGEEVKNTIDIDIFITQNYEDMGMASDETYIPFEENYDGLEMNEEIFKGKSFKQTKLQLPSDFNPAIDGRFPGVEKQQYNQPETTITGETDDRYLSNVKSYKLGSDGKPLFKNNLNMSSDINNTFNGVLSNNPVNGIDYVIGALVRNRTVIPNTGIRFNTSHNEYVSEKTNSGNINRWKKTKYEYNSHGLITTPIKAMEPNVDLSAITKVEQYFNVVSPPEVRDRVFINRGGEDIFERHSIMSEIKTRDDIDEYRDNYF